MAVKIIIDSTADVTPQVKQQLLTVPLTVHFGDREYVDGVTITHRDFYNMLVESDTLPSTSQATPAAFADVYRQLAPGDSAVVLTVSSRLSGTFQSAVIAAEDFENIHVVDSGTVAIGTGILAERALELVNSGLDAATVVQLLEQEKQEICLVAMVDTLEYLKRGGRISKTVAFAGTLLNIKPVLEVTDGEIRILGKARGSKQGNNLLVTEIQKAGGVDFRRPVLLGYTGLSDALLIKYMEDSKYLWQEAAGQLPYTCVGSVIGTHAGPGAIAVAFFKAKEGTK